MAKSPIFKPKPVKPKNEAQSIYLDLISSNTVTFGIGPAGTGKTFLAVYSAVEALKEGTVKRLILSRPAIEAGENLGFLPGKLEEKLDPYMRPLWDAIYDMISNQQVLQYIEMGIIEIAPLAYLRGRTFNDCFIVLDEAQNTTDSQMKMFLSRIGFRTKAVVTGDPSQSDLKPTEVCGITYAQSRLQDLDQIGFLQFQRSEIVRNPLISKILDRLDD